MPRFKDDWVIDRVLFDYVSGGSCACCGFQHMFLPNGVTDLINAMSDMDTDQAGKEVSALQNHPWPAELRDQVWADRVRLRHKMKMEMKEYRNFFNNHGSGFQEWLLKQPASDLRRLFQVPRQEISEMVQTRYNIHSAFGVVLCTVMEQCAYFQLTEYPVDGRDDAEVAFEKELKFDRRCGFLLRLVNEDGSVSKEAVDVWLKRHRSLGGPKLLDRGQKKVIQEDGEDDEQGGGVDDAELANASSTASFHSDRRIIRLLIVRYWADLLQKKYLEECCEISRSEPEAVAS